MAIHVVSLSRIIAALSLTFLLVKWLAATILLVGAPADDGRWLTPICRNGQLVLIDLQAESDDDGPSVAGVLDCPMLGASCAPPATHEFDAVALLYERQVPHSLAEFRVAFLKPISPKRAREPPLSA